MEKVSSRERSSRIRIVAVGFLFCLSGIPALVYQVSWQRILALHSGVGIYSVSMIVASFMAGLGLGSQIGGVISSRMSPKKALRSYAILELCIGLFAAVSCLLYYNLLYLKLHEVYTTSWQALIAHFLALVIPTGLMGMSLPFLVRAMVDDLRVACRTISYLYGINTLGAAIGALITTWILIRFFGIQGAVYVGACCNFLVGFGALILTRFINPTDSDNRDPEKPYSSSGPEIEAPGERPFGLWIALYTMSGFCALGLEIVWFRIIDVAVKSTAFTFGTVLAIYLFGLALGSLLGGTLVLRMKRPLRGFLLCQCILLSYAGVAILLLVVLPRNLPGLRWCFEYWRLYEGFHLGVDWDPIALVRLYGILPLFLFGIPTTIMGLSFAILQKAVHNDYRTTGLKVGILQSSNIAGCTLGSLVVGLLLLTLLGTAKSVQVLVGLALIFAFVGIRYYRVKSVFGLFAVVIMVLLIIMPSQNALWHRLHGLEGSEGMFNEDATGLVSITEEPPAGSGHYRVSVNGQGHSWLPFAGIHSRLGALPAVVHPSPREVAIIGLGSGDTGWSAGCRTETEQITVFELCSPEKRLLTQLSSQRKLPNLREFLADPRLNIIVADGRNALLRDDKRYDLIEADATRPTSAYSGNLYSVEFFQLCSQKLKPGGIMCSWMPTKRVYRTFCEVFPHVLDFNSGAILIGSNTPLKIDSASWMERLRDLRVNNYLGQTIVEDVRKSLEDCRWAQPENVLLLAPNYDLLPRDEYNSPW